MVTIAYSTPCVETLTPSVETRGCDECCLRLLYRVCRAWHLPPGGRQAAASGDETKANARLIAAAPALLESIDQVCAALETLMAHHGDSMCEADRRSRYAALGAARRAQANAEGFATWEDAVNAWSSDE